MSTPDRRARDKDRDAAIAIVEAAWADGQIIEADRDKRVSELRRAQTLAEIDLFTRDLRREQGQPGALDQPVAEPVESPYADFPVAYGPPVPSQGSAAPGGSAGSVASVAVPTAVKLPKALLLIPLAIALIVVVGVVGAIAALSGGDVDVTGSGTFGAGEPDDDVLTADGYDELVAAVRNESGSTSVFDAVLYPAYAVVSIPADASSQRQESYYWDGSDLSSNGSKSTATSDRYDLTRVDGQVVVDLVQRVQLLVEDPTTWYAIVRAPSDDRSMIWAYATNEYGETAYLGARRDGTVVYDSTEHS